MVQECERLGIIIDLAHINPAGFDEIYNLTTKPLIVSHTNARRFFDVERNVSDEQIVQGIRQALIALSELPAIKSRDADGCGAYLSRIRERFPEFISFIVVDMEGDAFCDSSGLKALLAIREQADAAGHRVMLRRPSDILLRMLELTGMGGVFVLDE